MSLVQDRPSTPYLNFAGSSPILAYEVDTEDGSLWVLFKPTRKRPNGTIYQYTVDSCGATTLEQMIEIAVGGMGLATYISRHKPKYEEKISPRT